MANKVMGWDLVSHLALQSHYEQYYRTIQPMACPHDGEPLRLGPATRSGIWYCPLDGFQYPRDWDPQVHSGM